MAVDYTTTQLIRDIKRRGSVPTNQSLFTDQDFIDTMSDCLEMRVIPNILRTREEFFVAAADTPLVEAQRRYPLPERGVGHRVRQVQFLDSDGKVTMNLQRVEPEHGENDGGQSFSGIHHHQSGYYFEGNDIVLTNEDLTPSNSLQTLRVKYFRRPNRLALITNAGKVTAVDTGTGSLTLDNVPTDMTTGTKVDIIAGRPTFDSVADSEELTGAAGFAVSVSLATAANVSIGDWVCFEGESTIAQIPKELHQILIQYSLVKVLTALGDIQGAAAAANDLDELERNLYEMLGVRDDGSRRKVVSPHGLWNMDPEFIRDTK